MCCYLLLLGSGRRRAENASSSSQIAKSNASREPNVKAPGFYFPFSIPPPADSPILWVGICSRKFREIIRKNLVKIKIYVQGGWANKFCKKKCPEKGFRYASCMFKRLPTNNP